MGLRGLTNCLWLVGGVLVVGSLVGARWLLRPGESRSAADPAPPRTDAAPFRFVSGFGHVDVEQGVTALTPSQPGRVVEVGVREGDEVARGMPLLRLDDRLPRLRVEEAEADVTAAERTLPEVRKLPEQHEHKRKQQKLAVGAARERLEAARLLLQHQQDLQRSNLQSAEEVKAVEARVKEAELGHQAEEERLRELDSVDPTVQVKRAEADLQAKRARLEQARVLYEECTLRAPVDGQVLRVLVGVGDQIGLPPRAAALQFCSLGPRIIRAEVEQEYAGKVFVNQEVEVEDDSRSGLRYTAHVRRISDWYTHRRSLLLEPSQFNDVRTLECILTVEPGEAPLRIGQRVRVKFKLP